MMRPNHFAIRFLWVHVLQYNQKYVKGRDGHDWLLRKNIWRRMRYRRENKKMVEQLKTEPSIKTEFQPTTTAADQTSDHGGSDADVAAHAAAVAASKPTDFNLADQAAVDAAVAAAESFGKLDKVTHDTGVHQDTDEEETTSVQNPLVAAAAHAALDAAAQLAAAAGADHEDDKSLVSV